MATAWHVDGCGKLGLCITASTQQSIIKSCSWRSMQRKPRTRISKALSTLCTRNAPPSQTSQDATRRCARFARVSTSEQRPCAFPASGPACGRRSDPILTKVVRWKWASIFRQNSWNPVPIALCRSQCPVLETLITCVGNTKDNFACTPAEIDKKLEGSYARICARAHMHEVTS